TEAATYRNALFDADIDTLTALDFRLQKFCGAHQQVAGLIDAVRARPDAGDPAVVARAQVHGVAPVQQAEHGLQFVVAVRPPARDAQEQVELGRRRPGRPAGALVRRVAQCHWSNTSFTFACPRTASMRRGIGGSPATGSAHW